MPLTPARECSLFVLLAQDGEGAVQWNGGDLTFKVVRLETAGQELLALADNLAVARAAFDTSVSLWPAAEIELRQGARIIRKSRQD
jgi:hypothetical protein